LIARVTDAIRRRLDAPPEPVREVTGDALPLTLIDEAQIDEDIEIARTVQAITSICDAELLQVTTLVCSLRGLRSVDPAAAPLPPLACANGLRDGLIALVPDTDLRHLLMRQMGAALGPELRRVYARLADSLHQRGVKPAPFRVKTSPALRSVSTTLPERDGTPSATSALLRLLEQARQTVPGSAGQSPGADAARGAPLRLLDDLLPARGTGAALDSAASVTLMERLLAQVEQLLVGATGTRAILADLREPARSLAERDSQLFATPDHPWWQFLDRLIAVGTVHDDADDVAPGVVTRSLELVVRRMREAGPLDRISCQAAVDGVQRVVTRNLDQRHDALDQQSRALQAAVDHQELEIELREQLMLQLRSNAVFPGLRQFLLGAWTQAMTQATLRQGPQGEALNTLAFIVDDLIRALSRPGRPVSSAQRAVLLRQVAEGLAGADLPASRVDAELADLEALLRQPPPLRLDPEQPMADPITDDDAVALHASLPTVPILLTRTGFDSTLEADGHRHWLDTLSPGSYCRLFLLGRWMTVQLAWMSATRNLFVFSSRHGGRTHSLTRRMLTKLRNAGLATTIEPGFMLAQALDTLAESDLGSD
jgi:hypothetical protein